MSDFTQYVAIRQTNDPVQPLASTIFELCNQEEGYQDALVRAIQWAAEALGKTVDEEDIPEWDDEDINEFVEEYQLVDVIAVEASESILDVITVE